MSTFKKEIYDCIIVGGGPAGLTAGIYLKRFRRHIRLIDNFQSRASLIPKSHNYPGFVEGISGNQLLENLRAQFKYYEGEILKDTVLRIEKKKNFFVVLTEKLKLNAKKIILATGVIDIEPKLPDVINGIKKGLIRHCPICDAYEVRDQSIGVIGHHRKAFQEVFFLLTYSSDITLLTLGQKMSLTKKELMQLESKKIALISDGIKEVKAKNNKIVYLKTTTGKQYTFDTLYSALGAEVNSNLALNLGANHKKDNTLIVNKHQETSVSGLYTIGDIVSGLNQICVATGQGAIAATAVHNSL